MARVLSIVIAVVASVLVFAASVLAVAALLFFRSSGVGSSAAVPTPGAMLTPAGPGADGSPAATPAAGSGPGATCRPLPDQGYDVAVSGAGPGDQVTVAVDLLDDRGGHHPQLVSAGAADAQGRVSALLPATLNGHEIRSCTVTAVQLGDRVVYAGR